MLMNSRFEQALDKLKMTGVRMTPQRHAILSYLLDSTAHPTADDIYRALEDRFPSMSVATVYNNLKVFIEAGLVMELTYGDDSSRFDANMHVHYHALCEVCGKMVDFDHPDLTSVEEVAAAATGFVIQKHRLEVTGVCPQCANPTKH